MADTTVTKIDSRYSPEGAMGQRYLASGVKVALRLWTEVAPEETRSEDGFTERAYEVAGYCLKGRATLELEGQSVELRPGDSWIVPEGARHRYVVHEPFSAIEATAPPAHVHARDERSDTARA